MVLFDIKRLKYSISDSLTILDLVNFTILSGKITAITGENGSGKSTFLKILAGLIRVEESEIIFPQGRISLALQYPYLFKMSVYENLALGLKFQKYAAKIIEQRIKDVISLFKLENLINKNGKELSGGEIKKVAIAQSYATFPDILLLDEPFSGVDIQNCEAIEKALIYINDNEKVNIIFTAHDPQFAMRLADELLIIKDADIKRFRPQNLLFGSVILHERKYLFDTGNIKIQIPRPARPISNISILPRDIIISRMPFVSSARNSFWGKILELVPAEMDESRINTEGQMNDMVDVVVDIGERIVVQITSESRRDLDLKVGDKIYLTFKVASIVEY